MKKFTDFHLYLGAPVKVYFDDGSGRKTIERNGKLSWSHEEDSEWVIYTPEDGDDFDDVDFDFKPVLRQLNDMTEEEASDIWHMEEPLSILKMEVGTMSRKVVLSPERTKYLLSKHFDLFGLIPEGLAIDSKTLK